MERERMAYVPESLLVEAAQQMERDGHTLLPRRLRTALASPAQAAPQGDGRSSQDRASDKWRGAEEIAARDYWHAHANGQPISESWLDGWLSRAKQRRAAPGAEAERAFIEAAMDLGKCLSAKGARGADAQVVVFQNKYRALLAHRQGRPACDERSEA